MKTPSKSSRRRRDASRGPHSVCRNAGFNAVALTQEEVSEKLNVNTETISRFERGYTLPPLGRLFELATLYGVEPETLVAGGKARSLEPVTDITSLMAGFRAEDREFVREWVAAMCARLSRSANESV